ncbi:MAG: ribbon-helix-helix domain-containing protein [Candidatus Xenobia bacterium]
MTYSNTIMPRAKVAVSIDARLLQRLDKLVSEAVFSSRSSAIQEAVAEKLERLERTRLARQCALLDPQEEKAFAEEGLDVDFSEWPAY